MIARLLIDFGLVILIWMTQLVVYPGFTHFEEANLINWHQRYTTAISIIVMPLMLGQVAIHALGLFHEFNWLKLLVVFLIGLAWINTFFFAVPLHNKIGIGEEVLASARELVRINWFRTGIWSAVFLLSLVDYLRS